MLDDIDSVIDSMKLAGIKDRRGRAPSKKTVRWAMYKLRLIKKTYKKRANTRAVMNTSDTELVFLKEIITSNLSDSLKMRVLREVCFR